ncbi:MAG: hypothetical protein ACJ8M1_03230 [Chthoniobacterales bacterium]
MMLCRNRLLVIWLCLFSATVTTIARLLNATDIAFDFPSQIQAAQHLLAGKGLSIYAWAVEGDLAGRARLLTMAHFPAGYSLCAAALMAMGFSVAAIVKTCGSVATILGWWAWAELGFCFVGEGLKRSMFWRLVGYAIGFALPLMCTPPWQGTEIFLWAAIPWVVRWEMKGANGTSSSPRTVSITGVLCGFTILMNYAAVFLALYAVVMILVHSKTSSRTLGSRTGWFALGVLPFVGVQIYINHFLSETESVAGSITLAGGIPVVIQRLWEGLNLLSSANVAIAWWMPRPLLKCLTLPNNLLLAAATLGGFALLPKLIASKLGYRSLLSGAGDLRLVATGFFAILPFCLWAWTGISDYLFVTDSKYYIPLLPLGIFIGYAFAVPSHEQETNSSKLLHRIGEAYSIGFVLITARWLLLLLVPGPISAEKHARLMGTTHFNHWPSMKLTYEFSAARAYALEQIKHKPDTVVVTNHEEWFYGEPSVDGSRITRLKDFRATYINGPARVLIVAEDFSGGPPEAVSWWTHYGKLMRADFFKEVPNLRLLEKFPDENVKVLEAWIPAGEHVPLPHNVRVIKG